MKFHAGMIRLTLLIACISLVLLFFLAFDQNHELVTISQSQRPPQSVGNVRFKIKNHGTVALLHLQLFALDGTNWVFVRQIDLGINNWTSGSLDFDVQPPEDRKDWKLQLAYLPKVTGVQLLVRRLSLAWNTRSLMMGHRLVEVWDGVRYVHSERLHR